MPEVLLSRLVLQSLGFNLDADLKLVREKYHNMDLYRVGFEPDYSLSEGGQIALIVSQSTVTPEMVPFLDTVQSKPQSMET